MALLQELGLRPVINASATLTRLGGSIMPPEVWAAMDEARTQFVDLIEMQRRVGERIAALTHNEAAYVSSGAAAGLVLATAACVTGTDETAIRRLPHLDGLKSEVIVQATQRNGYDFAVRQVGVRLVEIGDAGGATVTDLERAISPATAAVAWFQGAMTRPTDLPLEMVIEVAKVHGIPVIVDAAAQLPPPDNLWKYTQMGADLALFSGGKDLRGPQSSGLILGRAELIAACALHGNPNPRIGRPMKVGKEEMAGLLAAVERYLRLDHGERTRECDRIVALWCAALNEVAGVAATRDFPNEAGQPLPWCRVAIDSGVTGVARDEVVVRLMAGDPSVAVACRDPDAIHLNPTTLEPGEETIVLARVMDELSSRRTIA